ncbi:Putative serine/threonine-protein kinase pknH [Minicystis rosea]|nr:Putative serine/threonine-protein kinase pknH [Minicystis rosea]
MSAPQLVEGQAFADRYRLVRPLDEADPPRAFLLQRESDGASLRLDLFDPEPDPDARAHLLVILRRVALLEGPFIEPLIEVGVLDGSPWMITSTSDDETLAAYLARKGKLTHQEACAVVYQMSSVLSSARTRGLRPVDVAPDHFLVARDATGDISPSLRFRAGALARFLIEWDRAASTLNASWSTWPWMAPELLTLQSAASIKPAFEVWPLGLVAFQALTGQRFWREGTAMMAMLREVLAAHLPPASQRAAELGADAVLPPYFDVWFSRCVTPEPSDRFDAAPAAEQTFQDLFAPNPVPIVGNPKGAHYDDGLQGRIEGSGGPYREPGGLRLGPGSGSTRAHTDVIIGNPKGSHYDGGYIVPDKTSRWKRVLGISIVLIALVVGLFIVLRGVHR